MLCIFLNIKSDWRICIIPTSVDSSQQTRGSYEAQTIARPVLKLRLTQEKGSQIDKPALRQAVQGTQWTYGPAFEQVVNRTAKFAHGKIAWNNGCGS